MSIDPTPGVYTAALEALTAETMTVAQAQECYDISVRLYGAGDGQSIGYRRAITRYLQAVNSAG